MTQANHSQPPAVELNSETEMYVAMLFGPCEGHVAVRMLSEKGTTAKRPMSRYFPADSRLAAKISDLVLPAAEDGRGLFVVPCTVSRPGSAKAADIHQSCVVPVDLDEGNVEAKREHLERHVGPASMVVTSGGRTPEGQPKQHLYWKLTAPVPPEGHKRLARLRDRMATAAGADGSFARLTQPIRIPGSIHGKNGGCEPVHIRSCTDREYVFDELLEAAEAMPSISPDLQRDQNSSQDIPMAELLTMTVREGGADGITRFDAVTRIIGQFVQQARTGRITVDDALTMTLDYGAKRLVPPWNNERVIREFDAILRRDRLQHPAAWEDRASDIAAPPLSEDALAGTFVARHGENWKYVGAWGCWYHWTGTAWLQDDTQLVFDRIRHVCRQAASSMKAHEACRIASARTMKAVARIACSDPAVAKTSGEWDAHPDLLNTPSGTLDLKTGRSLAHDRLHFLTQCTSASVGTNCPTWHRFLDDITGRDPVLQSYLARMAGYCLSGETSEQVFFFLHGAGGNGKSEFLHAICSAIGTYAATAPLDSFMSSGTGSHPTDLAGLRGKRLVSVSETETGRTWAETRIKTITGGDRIRARQLYRDFFEFTPTFKLIVAGNHRPQLVSTGEAMRRRLHLIPFPVTISAERRDKTLRQKLSSETNGILGWMLAGHLDWRRRGLAAPQTVSSASQDYFRDEDLVGQWLEEQCEVGPRQSGTARALFENWRAWADANGAERGSQKTFGEALRNRGFTQCRTRTSRFWTGLGLRHRGGSASS